VSLEAYTMMGIPETLEIFYHRVDWRQESDCFFGEKSWLDSLPVRISWLVQMKAISMYALRGRRRFQKVVPGEGMGLPMGLNVRSRVPIGDLPRE